MALYDEEQYESNTRLIEQLSLSQSMNTPEDEEYLDSMLDKALQHDNINPIFGIRTDLKGRENSRNNHQSSANQRLVRNYTTGLIEAAQNPVSGLDDRSLPDPPAMPTQMVDTNASEIFSWDSSYAKRNRRVLAGSLAKTYSADYALGQWIDRLKHSKDPKVSPQEATNIAREQGADIKFDRPVSDFEIAQSVNSYLKRKQLEESKALVEYYGGDQGRLNDVAVIGSQLLNGVGPVELGVSIVGGIVIPELAVAGAAKAAGVVKTMLQAKKVNDAIKAARVAKNANAIAKGASELSQGVQIGTKVSDEAAAAAALLRTGESAKNLSETDKAIVKAVGVLEKMEGMRYSNLTAVGKMQADALAFGFTDLAFINMNRANSRTLGWDQYSEQDKAVDTLLAFGLGVGVPGVLRGIGSKLGFLPNDLVAGKIKNIKIDLATKEALGEITEEEASRARGAISTIEKSLNKETSEYKATPVKLQKIADDMASINTSDETLHAQTMYVIGNLLNGNKIDISKMPQFESIMSTLDHRFIKSLSANNALELLNNSIVKESTKHIQKIKIRGENGYFGKYSVASLVGEDASEYLADLYRGFILKDVDSLERFKEYAIRSKTFAREFRDAVNNILEQIQVNKAHKEGARSDYYSARQLYQNKAAIRDAYLRFRLGSDESQSFIDQLQSNEHAELSGYSAAILSDENRAVLNDFESWFHKYIQENEGITKRGNSVTYLDPVDSSGKKDYGKTLEELANEIEDMADNNIALASTDRFLEDMNIEKARKWAEDATKLDVSANTDIDNLLGIPRRSFKELENLAIDEASTGEEALITKLNYEQRLDNPGSRDLLNKAKSWSNVNDKRESSLSFTLSTIDKIPEIKEVGYDDIKNDVLTSIRGSKKLQERIKVLLSDSSNQANNKALELAFRSALSASISSRAELKEILGRDLNSAIDKAVTIFKKELKTNPASSEALLNPENLRERYNVPEFGSGEKTIETVSKVRTSLGSIFGGIDKAINIALSNREMQCMGNVIKFLDKLEAMRAHPAYAAEIITGGATQSVFTWSGSQRSIEHLTKHAGNYIHDLYNELATTPSKGGTTLLDVYRDSRNKNDIFDALVRKKWGVEADINSDFSRIAEAISKREATILGGFRNEGIEYTQPNTLIKRSNMQFADAAISDTELQQMDDTFYTSLDLSGEDIKAILKKDENGNILKGDNYIVADKKVMEEIDNSLNNMDSFFEDLSRINNDVYKKMTYWALRDFDLDATFDPGHSSIVSFNDIRDTFFSGDWNKLIDGDYQRFLSVASAVKRLRTLLLGKETVNTPNGLRIGVDAWAYKFRSGFQDLRAQYTGVESPVLNNYAGMRFKDVDAELNAVNLFGYDSIEEFLTSDFESMMRDLYSIEIFGTDPMGMVDDLINIYNKSITSDKNFRLELSRLAEKHGISELARYGISEGQAQSVRENAALALGLQNTSPATATRWLKLIRTMTSISLLAKAGIKGLADYGTIWQGLIHNSFVDGRIEAAAVTGKAGLLIARNKDLMDMVLATSLLNGDTLIKKMMNDPTVDVISLSNSLSKGDKTLVRAEKFARGWADLFMNSFGRMEGITNRNKEVAALAMQMTIAKKADMPFEELPEQFQRALLREGIDINDWNFIRENAIWDIQEYLEKFEGVSGFKGDSVKVMVPLVVNRLDDSVFVKELKRRGFTNITQRRIDDFRRTISSKLWNMIDTSSDEMISIPSGRIQNILTGGKARNSGMGALIETATQFQSFGASMLYNTYGRLIANNIADETGISILDVLNLNVRINGDVRSRVYGALFSAMMTVGLTSLAVDTAVQAAAGNIVRPIDDEGVHLDNLRSSMLGSLGSIGVLLDAMFEGIQGSGQAGSGFAIQLAPSISESLRRGYRITQPIRSSRVPKSKKAEAEAAAITQELARFAGLKSFPVIALVYQYLVGAYLDSMARGGRSNYNTYIKDRERRGYVIMPWERNPQPIWEQLQ